MHRIFVDTAALSSDRPELSREAANHLKVVRPKNGEEVELFDGNGSTRLYRYNAAERCIEAVGDMATASKASAVTVTLFACVTKGARWDWTLEKATELGVDRIVPVISARTIVRIGRDERAAKRERWQRIVEEAARQSDAVFLPEIAEPVDFADSLALVKETKCFIGALMDPQPKPLLDAAMAAKSADHAGDYAVYIGPEGDFTPEELAALLDVAEPVTFGPRILRAETAAIYAVAILRSVF